jgi:hypothetical protein
MRMLLMSATPVTPSASLIAWVTVGYWTLGEAPGPGVRVMVKFPGLVTSPMTPTLRGRAATRLTVNYGVFEDAAVGVADDVGGFY